MNDTPQITQAEIDKYISLFNEKIGHFALTFEKPEGEENSLFIYQGDSGTDANWSGHVVLGNDYYVKWEFSVLNGAYVEAKMKLDHTNKDVISSIYDFYEIWKNDLTKYLSSGGEDEMGAMDSGEEIVSGGPAETSPLGEEMPEMPLAESRTPKGRHQIISSSSDRMKKLAGL